jgi:hypothetical protein
MKSTEMPRDEIVVCRVKGLVAASNINGSLQEGLVVFIRGKYENATNVEDSNSESSLTQSDDTASSVTKQGPSMSSSTQSDDCESSSTQSGNSRDNDVECSVPVQSKEARVAKIYREEVYYPFIKQIRTNDYQMNEKESIPDNLTAVSWMDGCHGQLKLIMTEAVLKNKKKLKIISNKHSAARTAVEQAADVGPMFKLMKGVVKKNASCL